jgi:hypothetical protein
MAITCLFQMTMGIWLYKVQAIYMPLGSHRNETPQCAQMVAILPAQFVS